MKELVYSGQTLSHYQIVTHLATGGMGEVYKALDTRLNRHVALKILPAEWVEDANRMRRFIQEAKSASALNHPHIVTIYEIGEAQVESRPVGDPADSRADTPATATVHYIAMEFIDGETLRTIIPRNSLKMKKMLGWFADIADGLAAAHAAGIVHRDLKPDNIMIRQDGYAKVFDFGLAKLLEPEKPMIGEKTEIAGVLENLTQVGVVMGTVGYMSPEQVQGNPVDHRSDIFSFGCILFEAVTRKKAFAGDSLIDTLHKIVYASAPTLSELQGVAASELQRIIRKCLAKDPEERYQSIKEVANDLRELRKVYDGAPDTLITSAGPAETTVKTESVPERKRKFGYLALGLGGALILAVLTALYIMFGGTNTGKLSVESRPEGAHVFIDNQLRGTTPLQLTGLPEGLHRVTLELEGYESKTETFLIARASDIQRTYLLLHQQVVLSSPTPNQGAGAVPPSGQSAAPASNPAEKKAAPPVDPSANKADIAKAPLETDPKKTPTFRAFRGPYVVSVKHPHTLRRPCTGVLRVTALNIQYDTSHPLHKFNIGYPALKNVDRIKDKIIIEAAGIANGRIELQQLEKDSTPNLTDVFVKIEEFKKLRKDLPIRTATPPK